MSKMDHVLVFPLPIQGPVNAMLNLAELLSLSSAGQLHITFLTTELVHRSLSLHSGGTRRLGRHPGFAFRTFLDGLPPDHPRGGDKFMEMLEAVEGVGRPVLMEMLKSEEKPITCVIADGLFTFVLDDAKETATPVIYFETISPSCLWVYLCLPRLIEAGEVPFKENDDLEELVSIPGMGNLLRRCDLPDFCRANNSFSRFMCERVIELGIQFSKAQGIILNTFEALEAPLLQHFHNRFSSKVYVVGPTHLHLKEKIMQIETKSTTSLCSSHSLLPEDKNCIEWLNLQLPMSVIYCSFGSQVSITKDQLVEFWYGLVNSNVQFLWVQRPGSVIGIDEDVDGDGDGDGWNHHIPMELLDQVKKNGLVTRWVPQEAILNHPSIGGFLTHSGWNSTIESITSGVPMICYPHYVDQLVNSRHVSEVWRVGIDIKGTCDRVTIENKVRDLMKSKKGEFSHEAKQLSKLARQSITKYGSSTYSLSKLIDDIKSFKL